MTANAKATITTLVGNQTTALLSALTGTIGGVALGLLVKAEVIPQMIGYGALVLLVLWLVIVIADRIRRKH